MKIHTNRSEIKHDDDTTAFKDETTAFKDELRSRSQKSVNMKSISGSSIHKNNEERGMFSHKIMDMTNNLDIDTDKILSELIDSN